MTVDQSVLQKAKTLSPLLVEIRRQIHRHPELGFEEFETMLSRYYRLRGWDENGVPTPETLRRLELDEWTS